MPLVRNRRVLGDVIVQVTPGGEPVFESQPLRAQLSPLLSNAGQQRLDDLLRGVDFVTAQQLAAGGFGVRFDESRLEVVVETIESSLRPTEVLGGALQTQATEYLPTAEPAPFSAYLNINANFDYLSEDGLRNPELFFFGAARLRNVVLEVDAALTDVFGSNYGLRRRGIRAVYDEPDRYRRWSAGDLRLDTLPILRTPFIGGIAVERRRSLFDPFSPVSRLGGREIFIDTPSTVDVLVNGSPYQTFQLDPGRYDLSRLPIRFGANDIQIAIRDAAGRQQVINFNYFFDPLELNAGEVEYTFGVGLIAQDLAFEPEYSDDPVVIGSYRRALSDSLILGGATQISQDLQVFGAEATIIPQVIPGLFSFQGALNTGEDNGFALRASYRWRSGDSYRQRQFSMSADYQSEGFRTIGSLVPAAVNLLSLSASYSHGLSPRTFLVAGANYVSQGSGRESKSIFVDMIHQFRERFRITAGVEYGDDEFFSDNVGVRIGLSVLFGPRRRGTVDYRSRADTLRASYTQSSDNNVGSFGYDVALDRSGDEVRAEGSANYIGNRFEARASLITEGDGFGNFGDRQRARLQVGTSIAFAGGTFGIGRPITDSFAVVRPHRTLRDRNVIVGRSLQGESYEAASGPLGAAVQSRLSSYSAQDIQFDIDSLEPGYDIGAGVVRVIPPFHSGYEIIVGNDRFVSVVGTLTVAGAPGALLAGRLTGVDDEGFAEQPFFTNSAGRFGMIGLAPGKTYRVQLNDGRSFQVAVPADNTGLYRAGAIELPATR